MSRGHGEIYVPLPPGNISHTKQPYHIVQLTKKQKLLYLPIRRKTAQHKIILKEEMRKNICDINFKDFERIKYVFYKTYQISFHINNDIINWLTNI